MALVVLLWPPGSAQAGNGLCKTIDGLRREAARSETRQTVSIFKEEPMTFACGKVKGVQAQDDFCREAMSAIGLEFTHRFPWVVRDCLIKEALRPEFQTVDQYTGLADHAKIVHLSATWKDGARIEVSFEPSGDFGGAPDFKDYWGEYRLSVSPPAQRRRR